MRNRFRYMGRLVVVALALSAVQLVLIPSQSAGAAAGIADGPTFRTTGNHAFTFTPTDDGTIRWRVTQESRAEANANGSIGRDTDYASATGSSATFNLEKVSGKETWYLIRATEDGGASDEQRVQVFQPVTSASATPPSFFIFSDRSPAAHPPVRTYVNVPPQVSSGTHVIVVMHGNSRNADDYCITWNIWARENNYLVLCPLFTEDDWTDAGYNLGNVFPEEEASALNSEDEWSFTVVERVHQRVREGFSLSDELFDLWGHSAGGQFVHRFTMFKPAAKVRYALPANPGWYTTPELDVSFPYGLRQRWIPFTDTEVGGLTREHLYIFRGERDNDPNSSSLRHTPEADRQGLHRFARAGYFYDRGGAAAESAGSVLNWRLFTVPDTDHDQRKMALAAQRFLENPAAAPYHAPVLPYSCPLPGGDRC